MMLIVRMYPRYETDSVWKYVESRFSKTKNKDIVPLFMSQQDYQDYVSVVLEVGNEDELAGFFEKEVAPCKEIAHTRTITLLKPSFYPVPKTTPKDFCRFRVALGVNPSCYTKAYDRLLRMDPPKHIRFTYVTYSFGEDDILVSLLAKDLESVRSFVADYLEKIVGVESVRISLTHRTARLADATTWTKALKRYSMSRFLPGAKSAEEDGFDWTYLDHCCVHGAMFDEA